MGVRLHAEDIDQRVNDLLGRMTAHEKAEMLSGSGWMESQPIARLGIPAIKMADGPMGVRNWRGSSAVTNAARDRAVTIHRVSRRHRHGRQLGPGPGGERRPTSSRRK